MAKVLLKVRFPRAAEDAVCRRRLRAEHSVTGGPLATPTCGESPDTNRGSPVAALFSERGVGGVSPRGTRRKEMKTPASLLIRGRLTLALLALLARFEPCTARLCVHWIDFQKCFFKGTPRPNERDCFSLNSQGGRLRKTKGHFDMNLPKHICIDKHRRVFFVLFFSLVFSKTCGASTSAACCRRLCQTHGEKKKKTSCCGSLLHI